MLATSCVINEEQILICLKHTCRRYSSTLVASAGKTSSNVVLQEEEKTSKIINITISNEHHKKSCKT